MQHRTMAKQGSSVMWKFRRFHYRLGIIGLLTVLGIFMGAVRGAPADTSKEKEFAAIQMDVSALYISLESLQTKWRQGFQCTLVDVRSKAEFDKYRIPGSIHVPLFALKTRPFLKLKPVVLIHEGYPSSRVEQECAVLRSQGFDVSLLEGGLYDWQRKRGPLQGDVTVAGTLHSMSPTAFSDWSPTGRRLVLDVRPGAARQAWLAIEDAVKLPWEGDGGAFANGVAQLIEARGHGPRPWVILCDEQGKSYEAMLTALKGRGIEYVFTLEGGISAYEHFISRQEASSERRISTGDRKRCSSCP